LSALAAQVFFAAGCSSKQGASDGAEVPTPTPIRTPLIRHPNEEFNASIVQILAHRDRYHGKRVQVMGFLHVRFEGTAIYLSKDDAAYGITHNGFWVKFDKAAIPFNDPAGPKEFDGKYVLIEGIFDKDDLGHMSAWQGTIDKVNRIYELRRTN
jgi:hypothetical protein